MGRLVLALVLAGCASHAASGPAWPKESHVDPENDGGESIAPRVVRPVEATADKSDDDDAKPAPAPATPAPAKDTPVKDTPAAAPAAPAPAAVEESITTEDIVIEIDD